jgi:hypothetical protein
LTARSNVKDCWCGTWEFSFLTFDSPDGAGFDALLGHSITYRIALGPNPGRKAFTLQTVPACVHGVGSELALCLLHQSVVHAKLV